MIVSDQPIINTDGVEEKTKIVVARLQKFLTIIGEEFYDKKTRIIDFDI
jgi:hypothetical protein